MSTVPRMSATLSTAPPTPASRQREPSGNTMGKTLVVAEKPSVGQDLARALPGAFSKQEGYLESDGYIVTWAVGHLVGLAPPEEYDERFKKWRRADLPIVP